MIKILSIFLALFLISCSGHESPTIYFSNASSQPIKNIRCEWAKNELLTLQSLKPGDSRSLSFYISRDSQFFGTVKLSWINADGEEVYKEFFFLKKHLPGISDKSMYSYVQLYLDQGGVDVSSSDSADLSGKVARMDQVLATFKEQYNRENPSIPESALIRVQPVKDRSLPIWLSTSY